MNVAQCIKSGNVQNDGKPKMIWHAVAATEGFFHSMALHPSTSNLLQDALRLLGIWFAHGHNPEVC